MVGLNPFLINTKVDHLLSYACFNYSVVHNTRSDTFETCETPINYTCKHSMSVHSISPRYWSCVKINQFSSVSIYQFFIAVSVTIEEIPRCPFKSLRRAVWHLVQLLGWLARQVARFCSISFCKSWNIYFLWCSLVCKNSLVEYKQTKYSSPRQLAASWIFNRTTHSLIWLIVAYLHSLFLRNTSNPLESPFEDSVIDIIYTKNSIIVRSEKSILQSKMNSAVCTHGIIVASAKMTTHIKMKSCSRKGNATLHSDTSLFSLCIWLFICILYVVKIRFQMSTVCRQDHSFSTDEQMFLWKFRSSFLKMYRPERNSNLILRTHAE